MKCQGVLLCPWLRPVPPLCTRAARVGFATMVLVLGVAVASAWGGAGGGTVSERALVPSVSSVERCDPLVAMLEEGFLGHPIGCWHISPRAPWEGGLT